VSASGPLTVRDLLAPLRRWHVRLLAGERGLDRTVSWANTMRARLPAFADFQGGELALLSLGTLRSLRSQMVALSLATVVAHLADTGVSGIAIAGLADTMTLAADDARALTAAVARADQDAIPLLGLAVGTPLGEVENEVVAHVVARQKRGPATREPPDAYTARFRASLRDEALDALLSGTYAGEAQMQARAAQLGHDLTQPHAALWIELEPRSDLTEARAAARELPEDLVATPAAAQLAEALTLSWSAWTRARGAQVVALISLARAEQRLDLRTEPRSELRGENGGDELAERVKPLLVRTLGGATATDGARWAAGLGEAAIGPVEVRRSATEAHDAAHLGLLVLGSGHIARQTDLGIYRLLLALRESGELQPFVTHTLAPFAADLRNGDTLLRTLEAFFDCNGNLSQAAHRLHLHRNSLLYRLHRARDLLGRDLDDADLRLALQLAIKGRRVLDL
jgi:sugar diacid utilization regulator